MDDHQLYVLVLCLGSAALEALLDVLAVQTGESRLLAVTTFLGRCLRLLGSAHSVLVAPDALAHLPHRRLHALVLFCRMPAQS